jgi:hypothetical protein
MTKRVMPTGFLAFAFLICVCSATSTVPSVAGQTSQAPSTHNMSTQYLYAQSQYDFSYKGDSTKLLKRITQETGVISISSTAINP